MNLPGSVGPEKPAGVYPVPLMPGQSVIAVADADGAAELEDEVDIAEEGDGLEDEVEGLEAGDQ